MSRLAYLESLSRLDDEYKHKFYSDANILKGTKEIKDVKLAVPTKRQAIELEDTKNTDINWASVAFNTYLALNPYVHPVARLNAGLNVVEELYQLDIF